MEAVQFFEAGMLICFGLSWPAAIFKTWRSKNVESMSIAFFWLIFTGYACGLLFKLLGRMDWVFLFYLLNLTMVGTEILLYYRYRTKSAAGA